MSNNWTDSEVEEMVEILKEVRGSYLSDPKGQNETEADWMERIDKLLKGQMCGLFTLDFDACVRVAPRAQDVVRVEMDFASEEEAQLAIEQLNALLRATDKLNDIADMDVQDSDLHMQYERLMNLIAKMQLLRHGEVEV